VNLTDTTVLSNFAQVQRPDLLRRAFPDLVAPGPVRGELAAGERRGLVPPCDWSWLKLVELTEAEQIHAAGLKEYLQPGEAACIAVVAARGGRLLTDDRAARIMAGTLGIVVSGTIGVLIRLWRRGILTFEQADGLLSEMIECGYRSPVQSIRQALPTS
jgi:predicted nucleic acid-binding protein